MSKEGFKQIEAFDEEEESKIRESLKKSGLLFDPHDSSACQRAILLTILSSSGKVMRKNIFKGALGSIGPHLTGRRREYVEQYLRKGFEELARQNLIGLCQHRKQVYVQISTPNSKVVKHLVAYSPTPWV